MKENLYYINEYTRINSINNNLDITNKIRDKSLWKKKFILSSIASNKNKNKSFFTLCKEIVDLLPVSKFSYNNLGNYYFFSGKIDLAIKAYKKATLKKKNEIDLNHHLIKFYLKLNQYKKILKFKKKQDQIINKKIIYDINNIKEILIIRQIVNNARPHFAELYNIIELLLNEIDFINKKSLSIKNENLNKFLIKKINYFLLLDKKYKQIKKINANYENPYYNLGRCFFKKKQYHRSVNFFKLANLKEKNNRYDSEILKVLYSTRQKKKFLRFSNKLNNKRISFESYAIFQMASEQFNILNKFIFSASPLNFIYRKNIIDKKKIKKKYLINLEKEIKNNRKKILTPVVIGGKSIGNIFDNKTKNISILKEIIQKNITSFYKLYSKSKDKMIKEFPSNYELNGWFISLKKSGEVTSHIHEGWLSGVFYLKKPTNKKKELNKDLEFSLNYQNLPIFKKKFEYRVENKPGDLILFPSSLPHRVLPIKSANERLSIAFDMKPIN